MTASADLPSTPTPLSAPATDTTPAVHPLSIQPNPVPRNNKSKAAVLLTPEKIPATQPEVQPAVEPGTSVPTASPAQTRSAASQDRVLQTLDGSPGKPLSSFQHYVKFRQREIQKLKPDAGMKEIAKILGEEWRAMSKAEQQSKLEELKKSGQVGPSKKRGPPEDMEPMGATKKAKTATSADPNAADAQKKAQRIPRKPAEKAPKPFPEKKNEENDKNQEDKNKDDPEKQKKEGKPKKSDDKKNKRQKRGK